MSRLSFLIASFLFAICSLLPMTAQSTAPATSPAVVVPSMTRFRGTLTDLNGKPLTSITGVTFSLYKDQQGGAPLWLETQNVTPDKNGHYSVLLGSTTATGLPADVFASGEARWLGVRAEGQDESPRVLLVSVPYALKAADAETLGGLPASAFLQATGGNGSSPALHAVNAANPTAASVTGAGTAGFIPLWTSATQLGNSRLFQLNGAIGIGTAKPAFGLDVDGKINSALGYYLDGSPFATASISLNNSFFGFAGNSSTTGRGNVGLGWRAADSLTSGGSNAAVGAQALNNTTTGSENSGFGWSALFANTTGANNTALGWEGLYDNSTGSYNTAVGAGAIYTNATGNYNTSVGYNSGNVTTESDGSGNTFIGALTGPSNIANLSNATAIGYKAQVSLSNALVLGQPGTFVGIGTSMPMNPLTIQADDNGTGRGGVPHQLQIQGASNPNKQLLVGYYADSFTDVGYGAIQATDSGIQNTWVSLQPAGGSVAIDELVPITGAPLEIAQDKGNAVADGWATYSSRRWKTNIETLQGALGKIEKMRGVSYDLKSNGKHEIGVIAEEVGAVVPEIVQWEKNGKDADGVEYSRIVALLIEGMKEQQAQIHKQQLQIRVQQRQIAAQRVQMTQVMSRVKNLESSLSVAHRVIGRQLTENGVMAELQVTAGPR